MNSSNNSNYAPSSESNFGFNSPPLPSGKPAAAPAPSSRPRLLKVRKQSASQYPRSTNTFLFGPAGSGSGSGTGTRVGDLRSNPFQSSSYAAAASSVFGNTNAGNVGTSNTFLFGVNSNLNSQTGSSSGVVDELRKLNIGSEKVKNAAMFNSSGIRGGGDGTGVPMDESVVAELPNEIRKLNIDGKTENVGSSINDSGVDPRLSASSGANHFSNAFGSSGIAMELPNEMKKMNIDDARDVSRGTNVQNVDSAKSFVFGGSSNIKDSSSGKLETVLPIKIMNLNLKDSLNKIEKSSFDSGSSRSTPVNVGGKAENMISDELRKLKVGIGAGDASGNNETKLHDTTTSSMSVSFSSSNNQTVRNDIDVTSMNRPQKKVEFAFTSRLDSVATPHVEFKTPNIKGNLFSGSSSKLEAKKGSAKDPRLKKKKGKLRKPTVDPLKLGQDFISRESSMENSESFEAYSPMDVSPYQETLADNNTYSRETSVASDDASHFGDNYASSESRPTVTTDEDLITATHRLDINEGHAVYSGKREEVSENSFNKGVVVEGPYEESVSGAETESFKSAAENLDYSSDTFITATDAELSSTATTERQDNDDTSLFTFSSNAEDNGRKNFTFAASSSIQGQPLTETRHHKKKHRPKIGHDSLSSTPNTKISYASASVDFLPVSGSSTLLSPSQGKKGDVSNFLSRHRDKSEPAREQGKEKVIPTSAASTAAQEACEKWRLRGNQAYGTGDLSKAEDYYTQGVNSVSQSETSKSCLRALMLCYSNRAATRMSLGRMREALKDCLMAAALDSNFLKVQVRAANCYLALGEVEDALLHFMRCLQSGSDVCADRKILVEASEGLEKAQKVSDNIIQSTELLRRKTQEDVECALKFIDEALRISTCSEKLLEMKADALLMLRKYEQVIQLCEQTLTSAEINCPTYEGERNSSGNGSDQPRNTSSKIWRLGLIVKSYFYLGRLDEALDFVKKQEDSDPLIGRSGSMIEESVIPLADTIRELLSRKAAGNEAFQSGRHAEAVDHYTAALSRNVESRPFAAICFCNRAAAYRAMGQITDSIADCSLAIALDGNYLKAISRRAGLFELIRDYGQAATDYRRLVTLLNKLVEDKVNRSGGSDKLTYLNELRKNQQRLSVVEEEDRKEVPLNMYLILGVEPSAAAPEIKKAYRKAALKHHPDKAGQSLTRSENGDDGLWREIAEEVHKDTDRLFKMIGEAYAVLSNPTKRSQYDLEEEKRKEATRFTRSGTSRMYEDAHNYPFEPSSNRRQWQEAWRQYSNSQSRGPEKTRTSRYP